MTSATAGPRHEQQRSSRPWLALVAVLSVLALALAGCAEATAERDKANASGKSSEKAKSKEPRDDKPVIKQKTVRKQAKIPFSSQSRSTDALKKGVTKVGQAGRLGLRVTTFRVTYKNGVQTARKLLKTVVVRKPVPRIILHGTRVDPPKPTRSCDPNYAGCVPISSDVDCGGGSGNGPAYQYGSVAVTGSDIYDLDADGDGYGCD